MSFETETQPRRAAPDIDDRISISGRAPARHRLWRGPAQDPTWLRPAMLGLLAATGLIYLWGLGASGWANSYYAAAAQAGSESWKAFFFGSSDAANAITVDKPPLSVWAMALSVRAFGLNSWSLLVPQALMGVATVGLLCRTVRRTTGSAAAGLIAGGLLALPPVAALMFRYNNPDALLTLLLVGSAASTLRAVEESAGADRIGRPGRPVRWLAVAGCLVGLAFLTKMLQAFLVVPGLALVYLVAANGTIARRLKHLLIALSALIATGGWWIAVVELWPASSRPYIGGSQHNSVLELLLGYNGLGRITGDETGSVGGQGGGWGETGWLRLLSSENGGQVGWLLPAAVLLLAIGLWVTRREPRTDLVRAGLIVWGSWLVITAAVFSFMQGIFHPYYSVALAPAIAAVVAIGGVTLWRRRDSHVSALSLAAASAATTAVAFVLLGRAGDYLPWLKWLILAVGLAVALLLGVVGSLSRRVAAAVAFAAVAAGVAAPAAYTVSTASAPHQGAMPSAGPQGTGLAAGRPPGGMPAGLPSSNGALGGGPMAGGPIAGGPPTGGPMTGGPTTGGGGLLDGSEPSSQTTQLLSTNAADYTWVAAAVGSNSAAGYQLATQRPVMAIGGFNGSDPSPTLADFQRLAESGRIHYFIANTGGGGGGGGPMAARQGGSAAQIASWVAANYPAQTVGGVTVYDLSGGAK